MNIHSTNNHAKASEPTLSSVLNMLCPMHVIVASTGHITHVGSTLEKLQPELVWVGARFLEVFELKRPRSVRSMADIRRHAGLKLHLQLRDHHATELKGVATAGPESGTLIFNLSFGISVVSAVRDYNLTDADFAPTDLATEMLYIHEAKSSAMESWRTMSLRLQGAKIAAEEQAFTDTLTGLKNRRAMDHILERYLDYDRPFALMQVDLDYFKSVNDTLGHAAGDHVLQVVSRIMLDEVRSEDTVARVGGDEFVIVLPNVNEPDTLARISERIIRRLEVPIPFDGDECRISGSVGAAVYESGSGLDSKQLMCDVDVALYASKRNGRGRHTLYSPSLRNNENSVERRAF